MREKKRSRKLAAVELWRAKVAGYSAISKPWKVLSSVDSVINALLIIYVQKPEESLSLSAGWLSSSS